MGGDASTGGDSSTGGTFSNSGLTVADVAVGAAREGRGPYIVARDAGGIFAYSNVCTHGGCTIPTPSSGTSECPCHLSTYDATGTLLRGQSGSQPSLPHHPVRLEGSGATAQIMVNAGATLSDRNSRVAV